MAEPSVPEDFASGLPDLGGLMAGMQRVQEAQQATFEGRAGGGAVKVTATGSLDFQSVRIDPGAVDPTDVSMLEDLVLAALHDLTARIAEAQRDAMGDLGGLADMLGGLGLGEPDPTPD